jgi:hypothetical protein
MAVLEMSHSFPLRGGRQNFFARRSLATPPFGSTQRCPAPFPPAAA